MNLTSIILLHYINGYLLQVHFPFCLCQRMLYSSVQVQPIRSIIKINCLNKLLSKEKKTNLIFIFAFF
jgi:hypothetical protein